jgi:predicted nucleotidyltransferase component of viral defense system
MKILEILKVFCNEVENNNPFNLVLKGGTALSLYYFNHRESEDLDFDADMPYKKDYKEIEKYFKDILDGIVEKKLLTSYRITKAGFANTNRYHMKLELKTAKNYYSKVDVDFMNLSDNLVKRGELNLYPIQRLFIGKCLTFVDRKEFKDIYDIFYLTHKVNVSSYTKKRNIMELINRVIDTAQEEDLKKMFKLAFRNVDLRFKNLKESQIDKFVQDTVGRLRILVNKLEG